MLICGLFDEQFKHILKRHEKIFFKFDYHLLKRWLLKICFNSAGINDSIDAWVFVPLLPYILGKSTGVGRSVQLFVQLSYPGTVPDNLLGPGDPRPLVYEPEAHRVGHFWFAPTGIGKKMLRAVHLRSYTFFLSFFSDTASRREIEFFTKVFLALTRETKLLRASMKNVELVCNDMDAWESFYGSRDTRFVAGWKNHSDDT